MESRVSVVYSATSKVERKLALSSQLGSARLLIAVSTTFLLIFCYLAPQLLQNFCESFLSICSTMSGKGRLVRKFRHFFAKFWYILEIFAKFCLTKPVLQNFPSYTRFLDFLGITDLLTKSKFWPKHTFAGAPTATFFKILPFFWPPQLLKKSRKSLADPNGGTFRFLAVLTSPRLAGED